MNNLENKHTVKNLIDNQELGKYNYLVYGGYVNPVLIKEINVSIRNYIRSVIKFSENDQFKTELRAVNKKLVKEVGILEHMTNLESLIKKIAELAPQSINGLENLINKIAIDLLSAMNDLRVLDAIENKLPIEN